MLKVPAVTEALFYSKLPRAHPVVEPHACSHAIVELTNDRDHILWYAKTASTVQGRVRSTASYASYHRRVRTCTPC